LERETKLLRVDVCRWIYGLTKMCVLTARERQFSQHTFDFYFGAKFAAPEVPKTF